MFSKLSVALISLCFAIGAQAATLHICTPGNPGSYYQSTDGGSPVLMGSCYSAGGAGWVYGALIAQPGDGHTFAQGQAAGQLLEAIYSSKHELKSTVEQQAQAMRFAKINIQNVRKISLDTELLPLHMRLF